MATNAATQIELPPAKETPRPQLSIKAMLLLTMMVAIHLALLRANLPTGILCLLWLFPVSLMLVARFAMRYADRQIAQGAYFAFFGVGAMLGAALGAYLVRHSPIQHTVEILGLIAAVFSLSVIAACLGGVYSIFIIAIYGAFVGTLKRIGLV